MMKFASRNGQNNANGNFDWINALADAGIVAAVTFFTTLGGGAVAGIPTKEMCVAAAISAAAQFFVWLAIKRGLREKQ